MSDVEPAPRAPVEGTLLRPIALIAPYIAVLLGLFVAHSAWVAWLVYQLAMVAILSAARQWRHATALLRKPPFGWSALAALVTACAGVGVYLLAPLLGMAGTITARSAALGLNGYAWPAFIVAVALTNPWLEEVYWRGYLGSTSRTPTWSDGWFAGYHILLVSGFLSAWWFPAVFAALLAASWMWRQIARISGGLRVPAVSHLGADVSILVAVWLLAAR